MNDQRQNSKTDNDELRAIIHRNVWGDNPYCTDITGSPIKRNIFPSRRVGRRYLRKIRRGRRRRIPNRNKGGLLKYIPNNSIDYSNPALLEELITLDDMRRS